jgi:heat shock protein HslJ
MTSLLPLARPSCRLLVACCVASIAVACDATADPGGDGDALDGREFLLDSADGFTPVQDTTVRIHFDEEDGHPSFGFYAGCNHHSGPYEVRGGRLVLMGLGSTQIGCEQALATQDTILSDFFLASPELQLEDDRLTFVGETATLVFADREVADPDRPLVGRLWTVDTFITADAASNFALAESPTVRFEQDGAVEIFSGCNTAGGSFTQSDGELTLSGIAYTERGCPEPGAMQAEASVQAVLSDGTVSFEIEAARLTLMRGDRGLSATTD